MTAYDKIYSQVKNELAKFLANQSILLDLQKKISKIQDVNLRNTLQEQYNKLYQAQKNIETEAMNWISKVADLKTQIEMEAKTEAGIYNLISNLKAYTGEGLNYLNQGVKLVGLMLNQNKQVQDLKKSVEAQRIIVSDNTEKLMMLIYGIVGIGILSYILSRRK